MVSESWSMAMATGTGPTWTVLSTCPQPEVTCALQVAPSSTATVSLPPKTMVTYTVSVALLTARLAGPEGTGTVAGVWEHPERSVALQVAASITLMRFLTVSATYTVCVVMSMSILCGSEPEGRAIVPTRCPQLVSDRALQCVALTTDTD